MAEPRKRYILSLTCAVVAFLSGAFISYWVLAGMPEWIPESAGLLVLVSVAMVLLALTFPCERLKLLRYLLIAGALIANAAPLLYLLHQSLQCVNRSGNTVEVFSYPLDSDLDD